MGYIAPRKRTFEIFNLFSSENEYTLDKSTNILDTIRNDITYKKSSDRQLTVITNKMPMAPKKKHKYSKINKLCASEIDPFV